MKLKLPKLFQRQPERPALSISEQNETLEYLGNGRVRLDLRLTPQRQDEYERDVQRLRAERDKAVAAILKDHADTLKTAERRRALAMTEANDAFKEGFRRLTVQFYMPVITDGQGQIETMSKHVRPGVEPDPAPTELLVGEQAPAEADTDTTARKRRGKRSLAVVQPAEQQAESSGTAEPSDEPWDRPHDEARDRHG